MPKFTVENLSDQPVKVGIEPWAALEVLAPKGRAEFEYVEPAEIAFSIMGDGRSVVSIACDYIKVSANGSNKIFRPPPGCATQSVNRDFVDSGSKPPRTPG